VTDKIKKLLLGVAALAALALGGSALAGAASGGKDTAAQQSEVAEGPEQNEAGGAENPATDRDDVQDENGKDDATEQSDKAVTGAEASRAEAAAAAKTGGTPGSVERDSENGATYEVEVIKPDGQKADVRLDEQFEVVTVESDDEQDQGGDNETGEQDEAAEQSEAPAGSAP